MDAASFGTVSLWASIAGVVFGVLAAVAITIAAYTSSRVVAVNNARTAELQAEATRAIAAIEARTREAESQARAALAVANEVTTKPDAEPPAATPTGMSGPAPRPPNRPDERRFDAGDRQALTAVLKTALSPPQVELTWTAATESYRNAKEIERALTDAGWTVTEAGGLLTPSAGSDTSLTAGVLSDETLLLREALERAGLKVSIVLERTMPPDRIRLMIGTDQ